ncbi:homeodomain-interacting protein kinase 2 [Oryzias melastigma]|uniref:homeodomain-interacting protein kinase 2 n=1 Tax=Oryzias melastigma TaxID=30732 RepID=UPI000CF7BAF4|nr:homeodomain-interacting protein kinase 2 [Oryzias melastigma]
MWEICLVYEILEENLLDRMSRNNLEPVHLCKIRALAQQMFQALSGLKSSGVVHGDIKLDNIMFVEEESLKIKLIDFGLARKAKELVTGSNIQITPFRAPEVILGLPMDESIDMWALGVVLATVYRGDLPFPCDTEYQTIRGMVQIFGLPEEELLNAGEYTEYFFSRDEDRLDPCWKLKTPDEFTQSSGEQLEDVDHVADLDAMIEIHQELFDLYDDDDHRAFNNLLKRLLEVNPKKRITPSQALAHDFITMRHLSGENKASYAATAENIMRKIQLEDVKVDLAAPLNTSSVESSDEDQETPVLDVSTADTTDINEASPAAAESEPTTPSSCSSSRSNPCEELITQKKMDMAEEQKIDKVKENISARGNKKQNPSKWKQSMSGPCTETS